MLDFHFLIQVKYQGQTRYTKVLDCKILTIADWSQNILS